MSNYTLLRRQNNAPRQPLTGTISELLPEHKRGQLWAIDFETKGLLPWEPGFEIITAGFADQDGCFAIDMRGLPAADWFYVLTYILDAQAVAFNAYFDAGALQGVTQHGWVGSQSHTKFPWVGDAYALVKTLSTEGWDGQSWSLKTAMTDVLGWPEINNKALKRWLVENGHVK
jgi:hypothetical protein